MHTVWKRNTLRHQLALYRLCSDEPEQQLGARASKDSNPKDTAARDARQHLVKDSLGPAPVRVACVDADEYLWAWQWTDALTLEHGFPGDTGPWAECGDTPRDPPAVEFIYYDDLGIGDDDFG